MSSCLIITQGNNMFIGADSACSVKTKNGFKRYFDDVQKLFCVGEQIFFCSGNMGKVYECVNWINSRFAHSICIKELKEHLVKNYNELSDEYYSIEFLIADYETNTVYQLSQYNNFNIVEYPYSEQTRIICGGYKTAEVFSLARNNILMKKSIHDIYFDTYNNMVDECLGGYLYLYSSPIAFSKGRLIEKDIEYINTGNFHLLTSDFVTAGFVNGSQIIGGEIYSQNYGEGIGSMFDLNSGSFYLAGGRIVYDGDSNLTFKNVTLDWNSTNSPTISNINGLSKQLKDMTGELEQLDGRIQTYSQSDDPSINPVTKVPIWSSEEEKTKHIGDIWYDTKNSLTKRWNGSGWDVVTDSDLELIAKSKAQIFTSTPTPPYYKGDLWVQGSSGDIMNCTNTRTSGNYVASDWVKSSKYTDDTLAQEALNKAKQGIADAASGISLANSAQTSANNAQLRAESAETNAKNYADKQDKTVASNAKNYTDNSCTNLSNTLTTAYKNYTNSKVSELDSQVSKYLGLGGSTLIGSNYVISPYISGGYLNITNTSNNSRVIIDPNNLTNNNTIFQIHNGNKVVIGLTKEGDALFDGVIYTKTGSIGGFLIHDNFLTTSSISGGIEYSSTMTSIATSGVELGHHAFEVRHRNTATEETTYPFAVRYDGKTTISNADLGFRYQASSSNRIPCGTIVSGIFNDGEEIGYGIKISSNTAATGGFSGVAICSSDDIKYLMNDGWSPYGYIERHIFFESARFTDYVRFMGTVYDSSSNVITSDENLKNSIESLDVKESSEFIYSLNPVQFKYNDGTSNRYHHGLSAQQVKKSMGNRDWGLYVESKNGIKGLRYEELISDLIATVQTLNERVKELEKKN